MAAAHQFSGWTIGDQLRRARRDARMKQQELAQRIGRSRVTVSHWENNKGQPTLADAREIARATNAPWLLGLIIDLGQSEEEAHAA